MFTENSEQLELEQLESEPQDSYDMKQKEVLKFIDAHSSLAPQGSEQWLKDRVNYIGGSEIGILVDAYDVYSPSISRLVANHVGLDSFTGSPATKWGSLCEPITRMLSQNVLSTTIFETGSVINKKVPPHRYSMDGIGVVRFTDYVLSWLNEDAIPELTSLKDKNCTVLFEFKNVCSRPITGEVPKKYGHQVQAGLHTIDIADLALYVETKIQRVSLDQLKENAFLDSGVIAHGIIGFFIDSSKSIDDREDKCLGNLSTDAFNSFLMDMNDIQVYYSGPNTVDELSEELIMTEVDYFKEFCSNLKVTMVGFTPYVITKANFCPILRRDDFMSDQLVTRLYSVVDIIRKMTQCSGKDDLCQMFCDTFPNSKITSDILISMANNFTDEELDLMYTKR